MALLSFGLAWHGFSARRSVILLGIGLGRLAHLADRGGWPGGWILSTLEFAHFGVLALWMAVTVWFGSTRRPLVLPGEALIFFRRQSPWIALNPIALALALLLAGAVLANYGLPLLSVPLEVIGLSLGAAGLWVFLIPEARVGLAVILDRNMGWGNRIVLSGGLFRVAGRLTISKDDIVNARPYDAGALEMLAGARSLGLAYRDAEGATQHLFVRGASSDPEVGVLAGILSTVFKLALTDETLRETFRLHRLPIGVQARA